MHHPIPDPSPPPTPIYRVTPRLLGLGRDMLIGGPNGPHYATIDLSQLDSQVTICWTGADCGSITDGADSIVFQGVDRVILPDCMAA